MLRNSPGPSVLHLLSNPAAAISGTLPQHTSVSESHSQFKQFSKNNGEDGGQTPQSCLGVVRMAVPQPMGRWSLGLSFVKTGTATGISPACLEEELCLRGPSRCEVAGHLLAEDRSGKGDDVLVRQVLTGQAPLDLWDREEVHGLWQREHAQGGLRGGGGEAYQRVTWQAPPPGPAAARRL